MLEESMKSNAERFITAFNNIDYSLRIIHDFKRSMSFSDVIRRSVVLNSVVRKYEEDLIDYGRLRNAIVHQGNSKYIIAEPHDEVVNKIEKIAELITQPPLAINRVGNKDVIVIDQNIKIADCMELIHRTGYSNLPIYEQDRLIGVLNARKLLNLLGMKVGEGVNLQDFVTNVSIGEILQYLGDDYYYIIADENLTIDSAMNYFENNRKLLVILITRDGKENGKPLSIISGSDIIDMQRILDIY